MALVERAAQIQRASGERPEELGLSLSLHGTLLVLCGRHAEARESLEEALECLKRVHPSDQDEIAIALVRLGDLDRLEGFPEPEVEKAERSLAMLQRLHPGAHPLTGQAHHQLACSSIFHAKPKPHGATMTPRTRIPLISLGIVASASHFLWREGFGSMPGRP